MIEKLSDTRSERDADQTVHSVPAEPKFKNTLHLPGGTAGPHEQQFNEKKADAGQITARLKFLGHNGPALELLTISISAIEIGETILPVDPGTVEARKEALSIEHQAVSVIVRNHQNGRFELISGYADILALSSLGHSDVLASVVSGLTDIDAKFLQIANSIHPKLSALDRSVLHQRLLATIKEKVSQDEKKPLGGSQPSELFVRKMADHFGFKKDQVWRSRKIARINPNVHAAIREAKFANNQNALLEISDGVTVAEQFAKLSELIERRSNPRQNPIKGKKKLPVDTGVVNGIESKEISETGSSTLSDKAIATYDQAASVWSHCWELILALKPQDRERLLNEQVMRALKIGQLTPTRSVEVSNDQ